MKDFPANDPWAPGIRASHVRAAGGGNPLEVPWAPGVRAIDVPITPGGFLSPFAASQERAGDLEDNASGAEPQFSFDNLPDIPAIAELKKRPRWVAWKYATRRKTNGETYQTKPPVNPHNSRGAKVDDPKTWGTYEEAVACALRYGHAGVGYVLTGDDDISGHDLDKVRDPATGKLVDWAQAIVDLGETYAEISPSGAGIRMFWKGRLSAAIKFDAAQVEVYSTGRYLTVTGHRIAGTSDEIRPAPKTLKLLRSRVETFKEAEARARSEETIIPASEPGVKSARHRKGEPGGPKKAGASSNPFWRNVNDMAFGLLDAWVPDVFGGAAVYQPGTGGWRISSQALGRDLEEDLSIHPNGATDWGTRESLTAIDLVERFGSAGSAKAAALWLCDRCGVEPATLGWDPDYSAGLKPLGDVLFGQRAARPQPRAPARGPVADEARELLRKCLREIMGKALLFHEARRATSLDDNEIADLDDDDRKLFDPTHSAIKITTGAGKSDLSRQETANYYIPEAKRLSLPHRVLKLVPTHKLAGEARSKMPAGVTVAVWQGRGGTNLGTDEPMCRNPEAVETALKIGANVEKTACKSKQARCPFYESCLYQQQKAAACSADIVYAAHEILFQVPKALGKGFGLVVIDEGFWQDGLTTRSRLVISSLADEVKKFPVRDHNGGRLDYETLHLCELIERVQQALEAMPDGYVQRQPLIDAGLRPASGVEDSSCTAARKLEWKRKIKTRLQPRAGEETRQMAVKKFGFMGRLPRRAAMWHTFGDLIAGSDEATGRLLIETSETKEGPQRYLRLLGRKEIADKLTGLPLIVADATLPFDLVKHFLPDLELTLDIKVEAPFMKVTQLAGLPVGKASLQALEPGKRTPEKEERVARKRQRLVDTCRHLIQGRRGLIVTYKSIEEAFAGIEGTETGHFNAIEGVDRWKDVDAMVTIGRPLPRSEDIEHLAAAVSGNPIVAGPTIETYRPMGPGHLLQCRVYSEPAAEMIRAAVTEAAIEQAVGRARGVIRTEANPVEIYVILNDTVVPDLPVDDVATFQSMEPDAVDHMVMRGLIPESGTAAHKLHDDLFPSPEAARKAFERAQLDVAAGTRNRAPGGHSVTSSYRNISIRECHAVARYQTLGARQRPRLVRFDPVKFPDLRAVLEKAFGPLVRFEVMSEVAPEAEAAE